MPRPSRKTAPRSLYSVHPGVALMQQWKAALKDRTGRSLDEWLALVRDSGPDEVKACREWLKTAHGLGANSAAWIAERALDPDGAATADDDPDRYLKAAEGYVEAMFAGPRAGLRPVYDRLLELALGLGADVRACPCQTRVPLSRQHVFAQLKPATRTRLDLGLALGDTPATGRLIDTGGLAKKDRITHRIPVASLPDIDEELIRWLRAAYDRDG